jgi:hypothetical protein
MQQQRNSFARPVVDPIERLRGLLPRLGVENIAQRLLRAVKRMAIVVVQAIILKQASISSSSVMIASRDMGRNDSRSGGGLTFRPRGFSKTRRSDQSGWLADPS